MPRRKKSLGGAKPKSVTGKRMGAALYTRCDPSVIKRLQAAQRDYTARHNLGITQADLVRKLLLDGLDLYEQANGGTG